MNHSASETVRGDLLDIGICAKAIKGFRRSEHRIRSDRGYGTGKGIAITQLHRASLRMAVAQRLLAGGAEASLDGQGLLGIRRESGSSLKVCVRDGNSCPECRLNGPILAVDAGLPGFWHMDSCNLGFLIVSKELLWSAPNLCCRAAEALDPGDAGLKRILGMLGPYLRGLEPKKPGRWHHTVLKLIIAGDIAAVRDFLKGISDPKDPYQDDQEPVRPG